MELYKLAYKDKCFDDYITLIRHSDFKKGCLSAELVLEPGQLKIGVNDWNVNPVCMCTILPENRQMTTNILKTSIFCILHKNLQLHHFEWFLHHLTKEQMQARNHWCCEWNQIIENYRNLKTEIVGDETRIILFIIISLYHISFLQQVYRNTLILCFWEKSEKPNLLEKSWWLFSFIIKV